MTITQLIKKNPITDFLNLIRFSKPTGTYLLFIPCLWGIFAASDKVFDFYIIGLFFLGSFLMRSAGCIINDIFDRNIDCKVARTKQRPIASGKISLNLAFFYLLIILLCSLFVLLQLNTPSIILGFVSLLPVIFYPLMKRITHYPQAFLGFTFNIGILIGYSAIKGNIEANLLLLYASAILWTVYYDTIYAIQDLEDDLLIGVKSTAIKHKNHLKAFLFIIITLSFLSLLAFGFTENYSSKFYILNIVNYFFFRKQIKNLDLKSNISLASGFKQNVVLGSVIAYSLFIEAYFRL